LLEESLNNMKKNWLYVLLTILWVAGVFEFFYLVKVKHEDMNHTYKGKPLLEVIPKVYPDSHWKDKVSGSCVGCGHKSFVTKHWNQDRLYCENCKTLHKSKNKANRHYMYDAAITCMACGHKGRLPKSHTTSGIKCSSCKMEHYEYYGDTVLK